MSRRFSSLRVAPAETRGRLRDRLSRFLPSAGHTPLGRRSGTITLPDEVLLELLLHLEIDFAADEGSARAFYIAAVPENSGEPSFDTLIEDHLLRVTWGRISTPFEISRAVQRAPDGTLSALRALLKGLYAQTYRVDDKGRSKPELASAITAIEQRESAPEAVGCQSPEWIAARLWDRAPRNVTDKTSALRLWVDRWHVLGSPPLIPAIAWSDADALAFWEAAVETLESKAGLLTWDEMRTDFIARMAIMTRRSPSELGTSLPPVPGTLVDRALWIESNRVERAVMDTLQACERVAVVVQPLLNGIDAAEHGPAPHPYAVKLLALATHRAELFIILMLRFRASPKLLADVLLNPATSGLACLAIARWHSSVGGWDRELTSKDDEATKAMAFSDAVSVMGWFLEQGSLAPAEAASLLKWVHSKARSGFIGDDERSEPMLLTLHAELIGQSSGVLKGMLAALTKTMPEAGLGTPDFAAAVDVVDIGKLGGHIDAAPVVTAYSQSIGAGTYSLAANRISVSGATALFELATTTPELRQAFLHPIDIKARLAVGADDNPFTLETQLSRSLRAHIRILCRALAGWREALPKDLVDALISAVKAGALRTDDGRIPAFAPRNETGTWSVSIDRPIAADLGAALAAVENDDRQRLLTAILETDEPMVLAQLLAYAPTPLRADIKRRTDAITPSNAGEIQSLPEAQARIEALLSAGSVEAATLFIEAERGLQTLGKPPGRVIAQLRSELRLLLIKGDWSGISEVVIPAELPEHERSGATETINFYRALAALNDPNGDRQGAERLFTQLQRSRPDVAGYAINLFAARISLLLEGNLFAELHGNAMLSGLRVLAEAEDMMRHPRTVTPIDTAIYTSNKAVLLLALGKPQQAIELLTPLRSVRLNDAIAAYTAVALARAGQTAEAMAALDQAEKELGDTEVLRAARRHISGGHGFAAVPNTTSDEDPLPRIKAALWDLSQMDHIRQAEALRTSPDALLSFVLDQVRFAAASLTSLLPMMRGNFLDPREDDLNALIGQLLTSRVHFLNWTCLDQSRGGYTGAGNPGERDLVLRRDTAELAVIEAVICKSSITSENLKQHFRKLFTYSSCRLFFHLTYSYLDGRSTELNQTLQRIAANDAPPPFIFRTLEVIPSSDSRPSGFVARYAVEDDEAKVVFLVLDVGQHPQRRAAMTLRVRGDS